MTVGRTLMRTCAAGPWQRLLAVLVAFALLALPAPHAPPPPAAAAIVAAFAAPKAVERAAFALAAPAGKADPASGPPDPVALAAPRPVVAQGPSAGPAPAIPAGTDSRARPVRPASQGPPVLG